MNALVSALLMRAVQAAKLLTLLTSVGRLSNCIAMVPFSLQMQFNPDVPIRNWLHSEYSNTWHQIFEVKTSLSALSKYFVDIELDWRVNARSGKVGSSHCYLDRRPLHEMDEIVYEYDRKQSQQWVYVAISRVIFNTLFNITGECRSRYLL